MFLLIISIILAVITVIGLNIDIKKLQDEEELCWKFKWKSLLGLLWLMLNLFNCFTTISTGEVGLKIRFGKIVDVINQEGIVFKSPIESVKKIDIKVQKYENEAPLETSTKDMQIVNNVKISINYQIDGKRAEALYRKVGSNYKETILEPAIQEIVKGTISKYTSQELVVKREEISQNITEELNKKINDYGITCVNTSIKNFDFSQAYNDAIEQQAVAERNVEKAKQELEKTKIESEKKLIEAEATKKANDMLKQSLTDEVIAKQFIEKWDGKLPTTYAGNDILSIFNIK